ncbi:uncharacterized protein LOC127101534 [Lathyrus oleraceus]|uniref:Uncharacterized protein n=1 Tax=Pisum sativum TaxID=3888 RepID=A0A9D4VZP0_PEA|nr:uncharacterized protein LOC127101534 [Pisum sativum]KAI5392487.1 hypothetical protein KIW84_077043 [Pisum sativum]
MSRNPDTLFLDKFLLNLTSNKSTSQSTTTSAKSIVQAWSELRNALQFSSFNQHHHQHLQTLVNSQTSLHVADPQAKLLLSILTSSNFSLPRDSLPLCFRLLYIWIRKSTKPSFDIIDSLVEVISKLFLALGNDHVLLFSEAILLLGAFSFVHSLSENTKNLCLEIFCKLLVDKCRLVCLYDEFVPNVLAGIGYALSSSSVNVHFVRILECLFGIWGKGNDGPRGSVAHGLMVLYLIDWVMSNLISFGFLDKADVFAREIFGSFKGKYASFAVFMSGIGVLRVSDRYASSTGVKLDVVARMRTSATILVEALVSDLVSRTLGFSNIGGDFQDRLLLQCVSIGFTRTVSFSGHSSLFVCLGLSLLTEVLPLPRLYESMFELSPSSGELKVNEIKEHLDNILFKEAGAVTGVFCNQYVLADEENKNIVENLIWEYCRNIYYGHRKVAVHLKGNYDELLKDFEKIAESAFLMVVVFALAVTKHKLSSKFDQEIQTEVSLKILVSFSCVEYFRHVRLPEYMETIRKVIASVNKNEHAYMFFVNSIPSYGELTNGPDQKTKYLWSKDEVQTARVLFYLRVIPTLIECLPAQVFGDMVAPTMFLYMEHPNGKVARASHSVFTAFMSMGKESEKTDGVSLKEKLVFHYIQVSLSGYPGITPFEGMASGVVGMVQHLPAGSPATFYCIHSLVEKANQLSSEVFTHEADAWKQWQAEPEPSKKLLDLLLRLVFLVDIQVLPNLMQLLAQLITKLPQDAQNIALNELYSQVADSDDVVRKPMLVSWLQSLSYLCTMTSNQSAASQKSKSEDLLSGGRITAHL